MDDTTDFYEDDEPVEEIRAAFRRGTKGFTGRVPTRPIDGNDASAPRSVEARVRDEVLEELDSSIAARPRALPVLEARAVAEREWLYDDQEEWLSFRPSGFVATSADRFVVNRAFAARTEPAVLAQLMIDSVARQRIMR